MASEVEPRAADSSGPTTEPNEVGGQEVTVQEMENSVRIQKVCGERVLYALWDAAVEAGDPDPFRTAFIQWAEQLTAGYDRAVAAGTLPTSHDLSTDAEGDDDGAERSRRPGYESLQVALLAGDANLGVAELSRRHGLDRTTVRLVAKRLGVQITRRHDTMRVATEDLIRDGVTSPRGIIAELERKFPGAPIPKANTITAWKRRMKERDSA